MIKKLLSNAMLSIVMDRQAVEKIRAIRDVRKSAKGITGSPSPVEPHVTEPTRKAGQSRQELIAEAMAIHQSQSKILDDLTLNEKQDLLELAAKAMLGRKASDDGK